MHDEDKERLDMMEGLEEGRGVGFTMGWAGWGAESPTQGAY